jgi:hypothetical protein
MLWKAFTDLFPLQLKKNPLMGANSKCIWLVAVKLSGPVGSGASCYTCVNSHVSFCL